MAVDQTVKIFDQFYNLELFIDSYQYDIVHAFFAERCSNESIAGAYTETLFKISTLTGIPVQTLLDTFRSQNSMKITATMAYYLNSVGTNKTLIYGISNLPAPVNSVQRNIVQ
jgi:hypothetical protein